MEEQSTLSASQMSSKNQEKDDFEMALKLQQEDGVPMLFPEVVGIDSESEDFMLAQAIQTIEENEARHFHTISTSSRNEDSLAFSKINVQSAYLSGQQSIYDNSSAYSGNGVKSSAWHEAISLHRKIEQTEPEKYDQIAKHEPLLRDLKASEIMSEIDGVGDLSGRGLMVQKNVLIPVRTFADKQQSQKARKQLQKGKNNSQNGSISNGKIKQQAAGST
jgi:hypothetical protein